MAGRLRKGAFPARFSKRYDWTQDATIALDGDSLHAEWPGGGIDIAAGDIREVRFNKFTGGFGRYYDVYELHIRTRPDDVTYSVSVRERADRPAYGRFALALLDRIATAERAGADPVRITRGAMISGCGFALSALLFLPALAVLVMLYLYPDSLETRDILMAAGLMAVLALPGIVVTFSNGRVPARTVGSAAELEKVLPPGDVPG